MTTAQAPKLSDTPRIISMEVDDDDTCESKYRVQVGNQVKYLVVAPGTFDRDTLSFPLSALPPLAYSEDWTEAHISRDRSDSSFKTHLSNRKLAAVESTWHPNMINCLDLERIKQLTRAAFEASCSSALPGIPTLPAPVIAKIARFEWEIPRLEQETKVYKFLANSGLAPAFLGHIHENGRVMGLLLRKEEGRFASIEDLSNCEAALRKLHQLGLRHGDINRYNFLVRENGVTLIDFEHTMEEADPEVIKKELDGLRAELMEDTGRGGGFMKEVEAEA